MNLNYIIPSDNQFLSYNGKPLTGGHIEIFEAGTHKKYVSYCDFDGTKNTFSILIPSDGRIIAIGDVEKSYDYYVYDSYKNLVFSRKNITPSIDISYLDDVKQSVETKQDKLLAGKHIKISNNVISSVGYVEDSDLNGIRNNISTLFEKSAKTDSEVHRIDLKTVRSDGTTIIGDGVNTPLQCVQISYIEDDGVRKELIANQFNISTNYKSGEVVYYNGYIYRAIHDVQASQSFSLSDWEQISLSKISKSLDVAKRLSIVSNEEYLYAIVDDEGRILFGIKTDGSTDWSRSNKLDSLLYDKVDKENDKSLINSTFSNGISIVSNEEYLYAIVDSDNHLFFGITREGKIYTPLKEEDELEKNGIYKSTNEMKILYVNGITSIKTLGFETIGDNGGAIYDVVDSLEEGETVNDITIFSLSGGKFAKLKVFDEMNVAQFGAFPRLGSDLSSRMTMMMNSGVHHIKLDKGTYYLPTTISINGNTVISGAGTYLTEIKTQGFRGIELNQRTITIENLGLTNAYTGALQATTTGIRSSTYGDANHYVYRFNNLKLSGYDVGINLWGSIKWMIYVNQVRCDGCKKGMSLTNGFCLDVVGFYPNHCEIGFESIGENTINFKSCNFGTIGTPSVVFKTEGVEQRANAVFENCNFEYDEKPLTGSQGAFVSVDDTKLTISLKFVGNRFTMNGVDNTQHAFAFNSKTKASYSNNYVHNNGVYPVDGNILFNPNLPPKKEIGSLKIMDGNMFLNEPSYTNDYKPCIINYDTGCGMPVSNDVSSFLSNYGNSPNGTLFYSMEDESVYIFINGTVKKI